MTANTQHIIIREKWRCWSFLLLLLLSACSDYEYSIYDPLSPNYIDKVAPVAEEVDLGLSVNWASWNVGATAPEEYGNYYAWGEVKPRNNYTEDSYIYKYTNIGVDICSTSYDVAHVKWGDGWRMPTEDECNELMNKCSWTWTTINGTPGQKISGPNGKNIFLPAAGRISGTKKESLGIHGNYWTGSLLLENDDYSHNLYFGLQAPSWSYGQNRFYGFSVRPVKDNNKAFLKDVKEMSIAELLKSGEGTAATVEGTIVAKHTRDILLYDETGYILVSFEGENGDTRQAASVDATKSTSSYKIGDVVLVSGRVTSGGGLLQFPANSIVTKVGTAHVWGKKNVDWTVDTFHDYFDAPTVIHVEYRGVLNKEDDNYLVTVPDSTTKVVWQISYPASDLVDANYIGKKVQVTGYAIGYTDAKHVVTMATAVRVIDETAVAEAVDLGLSVKWASWNVGATAPEEHGGYYAWGETEIKNKYAYSTYKWCNGSYTTLTKYCTDSKYGTVDNKTALDLEDDVAYVKWGNDWRMPTAVEMQELIDRCSCQVGWFNGVIGCKVTGPNGNSIFFPDAGYLYDVQQNFRGQSGRYWSGTLNENPVALNLLGTDDWYLSNNPGHASGCPVRPVAEYTKTGDATDITISSATLSGSISNATQPMPCGIVYGTSSTLSSTNGTIVSTTSDGNFSLSITGLNDNTTYYYCAFVVVDGDYKYGKTKSFTTNVAIAVTTGDATDITTSSATLSASISNATQPMSCGFIYGTSSTLSSANGTIVSTTSYGNFSLSITGLNDNTTYYYCAFVIVDGDYKYGETKSFTASATITATTGDATDITTSGATLSGSIVNATQSMVCGIIYGTSSTLSSTNGTIVSTTSDGDFSLTLTELNDNTTYYYCAFVIVDYYYKYGEICSFTTEIIKTEVEAIDLGLSVKWASHNVGAIAPEEYGGYYAWGETEAKDNYYDWSTYKWCNGTSNSITKYCTNSDYGAVDNKITLDPEDDVAHVKWGGRGVCLRWMKSRN